MTGNTLEQVTMTYCDVTEVSLLEHAAVVTSQMGGSLFKLLSQRTADVRLYKKIHAIWWHQFTLKQARDHI